MLQIIESLTETSVRLGEKYGPKVVLVVLVVVGCGVILQVLRRALSGGTKAG